MPYKMSYDEWRRRKGLPASLSEKAGWKLWWKRQNHPASNPFFDDGGEGGGYREISPGVYEDYYGARVNAPALTPEEEAELAAFDQWMAETHTKTALSKVFDTIGGWKAPLLALGGVAGAKALAGATAAKGAAAGTTAAKAAAAKAAAGKAAAGKAAVGKAAVGKAAVGKAAVGKAAVGTDQVGNLSLPGLEGNAATGAGTAGVPGGLDQVGNLSLPGLGSQATSILGTKILGDVTVGDVLKYGGYALAGGAALNAVAGSGPSPPSTQGVADANRYAADLVYKAHQEGFAFMKEMHEQARADQKPFLDLANVAVDRMEAILNENDGYLYKKWDGYTPKDLYMDPGYQSRLQEGEKAIRRNMNFFRAGETGALGKALVEHGQRFASEEFDRARGRALQDHLVNARRDVDRWNRLAGMAGMGQVVSSQMANQGMQLGTNVSRNLVGGASALGAGEIGAQNALLSGQMAQYRHRLNSRSNLWGTVGALAGVGLGAYYGGWPGAIYGGSFGGQLGQGVPYL